MIESSNPSKSPASSSDFPSTGSWPEKIRFLCYYGILAPSVHNTQPWEFEVHANNLTIHRKKQRLLKHGDPTGRQSWISLGACAATIEAAANHFGVVVNINRQELGSSDAPNSVRLSFKQGKATSHSFLQAINDRFSDRSVYLPIDILSSVINQIETSCDAKGTTIRVITDSRVITMVAKLTGQGIAAAFSNPDFRSELADLISPGGDQPIGFSGRALNLKGLRSQIEPFLVRYGLNRVSQSNLEARRMQSASALVLVLTEGDTAAAWFDAGRAYQCAALRATALGFRSATTAAPVEAFDFHIDIEKSLKTSERLQTIMRIGKSAAPVYHSPRLPLEAVFKST